MDSIPSSEQTSLSDRSEMVQPCQTTERLVNGSMSEGGLDLGKYGGCDLTHENVA